MVNSDHSSKKNREKLLNVRALLLNFGDALTVFQPLFAIHVLRLSFVHRTESTSGLRGISKLKHQILSTLLPFLLLLLP